MQHNMKTISLFDDIFIYKGTWLLVASLLFRQIKAKGSAGIHDRVRVKMFF